jgi:glycosyltransferase involved in cell wall biosynthesis
VELSGSDCRPIYNRIISIGRLDEQKGFDLLIKAFSIVHKNEKDWYLDIYGNGLEYDKLTRCINHLDLRGKIKIKNSTPAIYEEYKKSDFFVLSSRYEGFGLVLAEAMFCGIPCVSFNCDYGPSEIIHDGEDGLLVKNGDVEDLAKKIDWMITHEKERKEMGIHAHESAKRYAKEPIMQQWMKLFDEMTVV